MTKILIKKISKKAKIPKYETDGASGLDISACLEKKIIIKPGEKYIVPTGIAVAIEKNYEIQIRPRSGLAAKNSISVLNSPGTIDNSYRKEIGVILYNKGHEPYTITKGDKIAQMLIRPLYPSKMEIVEHIEDTGRAGYGSTGK